MEPAPFFIDEFGRKVSAAPPPRRDSSEQRWDSQRGDAYVPAAGAPFRPNSSDKRWDSQRGDSYGNKRGGGRERSNSPPRTKRARYFQDHSSSSVHGRRWHDDGHRDNSSRWQDGEGSSRQDRAVQELEEWVTRRAEDDFMRETYLPAARKKMVLRVQRDAFENAADLKKSIDLQLFSLYSIFSREDEESVPSDIFEKQSKCFRHPVIFFSLLPCFFSREEIEECIAKAEREAVVLSDDPKEDFADVIQCRKIILSCSRKNAHKKFERVAWLSYSSGAVASVRPEAVEKFTTAMLSVFQRDNGRQVVDDHSFRLTARPHRPASRSKQQLPLGCFSTDTLAEDMKLIVKLSLLYDRLRNLNGHCPVQEMMETAVVSTGLSKEENESADRTRLRRIKRLEVGLTYLLRVHNVSFYTGEAFVDQGDAMHALGDVSYTVTKQALNSMDATPTEAKQLHVARIEAMISSVKKEISTLCDALTGSESEFEDHYNKVLEAFVRDQTVQEGTDRYRCRLPPHKLFKAPSYIRKYILKHHERLVKRKAEVSWVVSRHAGDPNRNHLMLPQMARDLGLAPPPKLQRPDSRGGANTDSGFRAYDAPNGSKSGGEGTASRHEEEDVITRRLKSFKALDKTCDTDDLVYERG
jgi:hypothetical protein